MSKNNATNNLFLNQPLVQTATNYTALATDVIIEVTSTAAPRTITLPAPSAAASTSNVGKFYVIKDTSGGAATNNISVVSASGTIDGSGSLVIGINYGAVQVYTDGTSYYSQALVTSPLTGIPFASGSWTYNTGALSGLGASQQPNWPMTTIGSLNSRINFSQLSLDHVSNITVDASNRFLTMQKTGMYYICCDFSMQSSSGSSGTIPIAQIIKNNATILNATITTTNISGTASFQSVRITANLTAGDIIDFRFNSGNTIGFFFQSTLLIVQQLPLTS